MLDFYGLTQIRGSVTFTAVVLASVEVELLCLGIHTCFAVGFIVLPEMVHSSSVTEWLT